MRARVNASSLSYGASIWPAAKKLCSSSSSNSSSSSSSSSRGGGLGEKVVVARAYTSYTYMENCSKEIISSLCITFKFIQLACRAQSLPSIE